jgi:hypothetical protein
VFEAIHDAAQQAVTRLTLYSATTPRF